MEKIVAYYFPVITSAKEVMFSSLFVCLSVCLFVSNFAQKLPNGFAWNFQRKLAVGHWKKMVKFWWRYGWEIRIRIRICIATPIKRASAEVCTVPVLLVVVVVFVVWMRFSLKFAIAACRDCFSFPAQSRSSHCEANQMLSCLLAISALWKYTCWWAVLLYSSRRRSSTLRGRR